MSNYYNEDDKNERYFYTPDHYDDEDSFNDKRYSYSSVHSDDYSKYFDNEQPKHRFMSLNNKNKKGLRLTQGNKKNKIFEYSPSIEIDKQSRDNSTRRYNNISESQNEKINNLSVINVNRSGIEEPEDIFNKKRIEEIAYDKYVINYSKDLRIVKNNKILLKNEKQGEILDKKQFDNKLIFKENENMLELKAENKTDEQKLKDIFNNKKLYLKLKAKIEKEDEKYRHNNITGEEQNSIPNVKDNRFKLLQKSKRTKDSYITIQQEQNKDYAKEKLKLNILKQSNENNFEIKSEYYYIETKDSVLPEIIEKKIQESNKRNQTVINIENEFKGIKTKLSSGDNFNIKAEKKEYLRDIESNELTIVNKDNIKKKKNKVKKNEDLVIYGQTKKWNYLKNLDSIIVNNEFSLNNEKKINSNFLKDKEKVKEENKINKKFDVIIPSKNQKLEINKQNIPTGEKKLFKCNENSININSIKKPKSRKIKITTKKILKHERILSRRKFSNIDYTPENSFSIQGNKIAKSNLGIKKNEEFLIKRKKKKMKEQEIQATEEEKKKIFENIKMEELDEINIDSQNDAFLENYLNNKYFK